MSDRFLSAVFTVMAAALMAPLATFGQAAADDWTPPHTADGVPDIQGLFTLIAKSSKHENAKQPHWAQARSSCWGTRSPPL